MNRKLLISSLAAAASLLGVSGHAQSARDYISIVGSSTVYPFTTTVAEQFGRAGKFKTPKVESTGTGGGIKLFCNGVGVQYPGRRQCLAPHQGRRSSRRCAKNGVKDVVEVKVGYDGIVLAQLQEGRAQFKLTRKDIYLALAKQVPDPANPQTLIANPYTTWKQVNTALPRQKIEVLGPPPTSGTRDAFVELVMEAGCRTYPWIKTLKDVDEARFKRVCHTIREDGALRRGRRERQPDRAEARSQSEGARHLRLQLPRGERRQAAGLRSSTAWRRRSRTSPPASIRSRGRCSST